MALIQVVTTTSSKAEAEKLAQLLIAQGIAACCQISGPITSIYPWNSNVQQDEEWKLTIKTLEQNYTKIEKVLKRSHSYSKPQILALPITHCDSDYHDWITSNC